jgi:hypothetical protein
MFLNFPSSCYLLRVFRGAGCAAQVESYETIFLRCVTWDGTSPYAHLALHLTYNWREAQPGPEDGRAYQPQTLQHLQAMSRQTL